MSSEVVPTPQSYGAPAPMPSQYGPPPQHYIPMTAPTSGSAVAALICSILWVGGLGSVVALILVGTSWSETRSGRRGGHGMNVVSLILGVLGVVPMLFFIGIMLLGLIGVAGS